MPWKLIYCEGYLNQKDATGREKFLKSGAGRTYLKKQLSNYLVRTTRHQVVIGLPRDERSEFYAAPSSSG